MAGSQTQISLKLLVDSKANKVMFAEAGKEFVDFIFHIMSLPLGTVVKLLTQERMVGCLGDLYKSAESLNDQYFLSTLEKDSVLNPITAVNIPLLALNEAPTPKTRDGFYRCGSAHSCKYVTDSQGKGMTCPGNCGGSLSITMKFVKPTGSMDNTTSSNSGRGGYVKGLVTYMVMDNMEIKPMSTISGITLINKFHVKDVSTLEEKEVQVGLKEGLAILKASIETKAVLSLVFLGSKI